MSGIGEFQSTLSRKEEVEHIISILRKRKKLEFEAAQKCVHVVDLEKCCHVSVYLQEVGFDTAKNEPSKVL